MSTLATNCQMITVQTSPEILEHMIAVDLFFDWRSHSRNGALPVWKDISLVETVKAVPNLVVIEVGEGPPHFKIKMLGTKLIQDSGQDKTNASLSEVPDADQVLTRCRSVLETRCGYYLTNAPANWSQYSYKSYSTLVLPTTDEMGRITNLLGWVSNF